MKLSIIIVNYKTPDLLLNCVNSINKSIVDFEFEIIIVDNDSNDNSEILIKSNFANIIWINNSTNEGFGRANNIGYKFSKGEYILLLNSDTLIFNDTLQKTIESFEKLENDFVAATVVLKGEEGNVQKSAFYANASFKEILTYNTLFDFLFKPKIQNDKIRAIHGAFFLIKRNVIDEIGFFDPDFFMYSEEFDLCNRIIKNNYQLSILNEIYIIHLEGKSSFSNNWNTRQRLASIALLFKKKYGISGYFLYLFLLVFNDICNFMILWKMNKNYRKSFFDIVSVKFCLTIVYFQIAFNLYKSPLKVN